MIITSKIREIRGGFYKRPLIWMVFIAFGLWIGFFVSYWPGFKDFPETQEISINIPEEYSVVFLEGNVVTDTDALNYYKLLYEDDPSIFESLTPTSIVLYGWDDLFIETESAVFCESISSKIGTCLILIKGHTEDEMIFRYKINLSYMNSWEGIHYEMPAPHLEGLTIQGIAVKKGILESSVLLQLVFVSFFIAVVTVVFFAKKPVKTEEPVETEEQKD